MKVLITGITGLLGSYIAKRFADLGEIYGFKRPESDLRLLGDLADKIYWYEGDMTNFQSLEEAVSGKDLVINTAGMVSFDPADNDQLMKINVEGTANLVNAMLEKDTKKLIHISSVSALGKAPGISLFDENIKWVDSNLNSTYAISKYLGELEVWRAAQEGLEVMVLLPSVILGKIEDQRSSTRIYDYILKENNYYPTGYINYIDVRDAAENVFQLYEKGVWGEKFILNNQSISYKEFFQEMAQVFGKKAPKKPIHSNMLPLVLGLFWIGRKLGISKTKISSRIVKSAQMKVTMDNSKIQKLLHYQYTTLKDTLSWARANENH